MSASIWAPAAEGPKQRMPASPMADILAGLTVSLALVPEAVAFAFVAGVDPMIGLWSACIIWRVTSPQRVWEKPI